MKTLKSYLILGFFVTGLAGTLLHFVYQWTGENAVAALFSPINESTWEHMKLIFFPVTVWALLIPESLKDARPSLLPALMLSALVGTWSIPVLFYTYSGILGRNFAPLDISTFFISLLIAFLLAWKLSDNENVYRKRLLIYGLCALMAGLFFLFTFFPPEIGLFREP